MNASTSCQQHSDNTATFICKKKRFLKFKHCSELAYHKILKAILKVPSGQNGSAWEWYHWTGLEKDINRYRFFIFIFLSWIFDEFKVLSRFMQKWIQPPAGLNHKGESFSTYLKNITPVYFSLCVFQLLDPWKVGETVEVCVKMELVSSVYIRV